MSMRVAQIAIGLRICPICRSGAVREMRTEGVGWIRARLLVHCGACETRREVVLDRRTARVVRRRLARRLRRDRRVIARALEAAGRVAVIGPG